VGQLLLLGLVQGLAEFLPVSSSGHLLLLRTLWGQGSAGPTVEVLLHGATLVSVLVALWPTLAAGSRALRRGDPAARRLLAALAVGTVPAGVLGALGGEALGLWLFRPEVAAVGFLATAGLLATAPDPTAGGRSLAEVGWGDALLIGAMQALALCPGLSRSAATMTAGRWCGLEAAAAAEFSFLLALPVTAGAVAVSLPEVGRFGAGLALAAVVASTAGILAVKWALRGIQTRRWWKGFAAYTLGLALVAGWVSR
jgi:undecaprenyl-diphosphatase